MREIFVKYCTFFLLLFIFYYAPAKSTFSSERLKQSCLDYINRYVAGDAVISINQNIKEQEFTDDGITARIDADVKELKGNTHLAIVFLNEGKSVKRLEIAVRIRIYRNVAVTTKSVLTGDIFNESDFTTAKDETTYIPDKDIPDKSELIGIKAKRNIPRGTIITRDMLDMQNMIHRGDKVNLIIRSGAVLIKTTAVALQDAEYGNKIRIKRDGANNVLYGVVDYDGSVLITAN